METKEKPYLGGGEICRENRKLRSEKQFLFFASRLNKIGFRQHNKWRPGLFSFTDEKLKYYVNLFYWKYDVAFFAYKNEQFEKDLKGEEIQQLETEMICFLKANDIPAVKIHKPSSGVDDELTADPQAQQLELH